MNPFIFSRPLFYISRGILVRVLVRRNRELIVPLLSTLFTTSLTLIQHLGIWNTLKLLFTMRSFTGVTFKEVLNKLQNIFTSDVFSIFHKHVTCTALPTLWDKAIKLNNFSKFFYSFLAVTVIGNLTPLFMLLGRIVFYTFFGSLSVLYTSTLSSYTILKWIATKFITFYEWLFHFKLPNRISIDGVHSYIPVNISKIWNTGSEYLSSIKQSWIDPLFGVEHKSTSTWLWDNVKTGLVVFGTILIGFVFFDYIPYTSEWIRKIPCIPSILNTIEYIPNKIGNWIWSWFSTPQVPGPLGGDNTQPGGSRGISLPEPTSTGEGTSSSYWPWSKTTSSSAETATASGNRGVNLTGRSHSLSYAALDNATRSAAGYLGDIPGSNNDWGSDDGESIDLQADTSSGTATVTQPQVQQPMAAQASQTPTPAGTPTHTPQNSRSNISRTR